MIWHRRARTNAHGTLDGFNRGSRWHRLRIVVATTIRFGNLTNFGLTAATFRHPQLTPNRAANDNNGQENVEKWFDH